MIATIFCALALMTPLIWSTGNQLSEVNVQNKLYDVSFPVEEQADDSKGTFITNIHQPHRSGNSKIARNKGKTKKRTCLVPYILSPVCGADGRTYPNEYVAKCMSQKVIKYGECKKNHKRTQKALMANISISDNTMGAKNENSKNKICIIYLTYEPVCASDGNTYMNKYFSKCLSLEVVKKGECQKNPKLTKKGFEGITEDRAKIIIDDGMTVKNYYKHKHKKCKIPRILLPVCASDGQTYANKYAAKCKSLKIVGEGECNSYNSTKKGFSKVYNLG